MTQFRRMPALFGPPFCISILKVSRTQILPYSLDFNAFYMIMEYFLRLFKFPQIKKRGPDFWGEPILQKIWIIWSPLLSFNFKSFKDPNSSSFIRFQRNLHDSGIPFSNFWNSYKLKPGNRISWGQPILKKVWIIWYPILYFNFKSFKDPNSFSFIRFQCILHDWGIPFSDSLKFLQIKEGDLIFWGTNSAESVNYLVPPPSVFEF